MAATVSFPSETEVAPMRKKLKTSDLPLASATRAAIEGLAHTFKKKGGYDSLRKQVWADLTKSTFESEFTESLIKAAELELEKNDYDLLRKSRSTAQALIHGAVERAGVYRDSEQQIDALIDAHIADIEIGIRAIRKNDIGEEAAEAEKARGGKTDEQYAEEANERREAREKARREAREKELAIQEKKREEERVKKIEEEKKLEEEMEKKRIEREARRKAEREREEQKERDLKERERREREKERERRQRRHEDESGRKDTKEQPHDSTDSKIVDMIKPELTPEEIERLEREALNHLLKPSSSRVRHHLEIDDTLTPPPRKIVSNSAIQPISRDHSKLGIKKPSAATNLKVESRLKVPVRSNEKFISEKKTDSSRKRSRSHDRGRGRTALKRLSQSRSRSRSRSRHVRNRDERHSRRDSKDRPRDDRHRNYSRERETRHKDDRRKRSKDRDDNYRHERRHSHRSHSVLIEKIDTTVSNRCNLETQTKEKGSPYSGSRPIKKEPSLVQTQETGSIIGTSSTRKPEFSHDRMKHARSRSRSIEGRKRSRIERSTSPINIDRYVPSAHRRSRRDDTYTRSPTRKRDKSRSRDRDRGRDKISRYSRDDDRSRRRSRSNSQSRRKYRSRERSKERVRGRSTSPFLRRERDGRKDRSRSRDKRKERHRDRDRDRDRSRDRYRDHEEKYERVRSRERNRDKDRTRKRSRSR